MSSHHEKFAAIRAYRNRDLGGARKPSERDIRRMTALREIEARRLAKEARQ